jgi:rod shape-determining protein MreC
VVRLSPARRAALHRIALPLLVLLSAVMIILGKADEVVIESLRRSALDVASAPLEFLSRPTVFLDTALDRGRGFITLYEENERLRQENEKLLRWQRAALNLASENTKLRDLLKLTPEPAISYVTARVIANSGGAYARSLMVNAGRESGVGRGQAAVTGDGLIGRVVEVGSRAARILLITDLNSRVPVIVEGSRQRAVLAGDNSERPSLLYLEPGPAARIGDRVVTSGQGGVFPPGLPVGAVAGLDGNMSRVEPYAELSRVDYVRIVDYGLGDALPDPLPLARRAKRSDPPANSQTGPR